jgi:hypothetical protein
MRLDKKRPFATVTGHDPNVHHLYEQNGRFFNSELDEVDPKTGKCVDANDVPEKPIVEKNLGEKIPPKEENGYTGLSWNQSDVPDEEAPRIVAVEIDGEPITVDMNENYYSSRDEIKAMLDKLGGKYLARDSRTTLWKKLVATAKALEAEQNG